MARMVALLRAVNVGGTGKMPMADLRAIANSLGLGDARTYIQSGNLVFTTDLEKSDLRSMLESALENYAGKPVGVLLRSAGELQKVLETNPFAAARPSAVGILFLPGAPEPDLIETARRRADEQIMPGAQEVYIHYPSGMGQSKMTLPAQNTGTMRNLNTVAKLAEMARTG